MEDKIVEFKIRGKLKQKILTKEAMALKLIRIKKRITREAAGAYIGRTEVAIERYENGMTSLPENVAKKLLRKYKVSHDEFKAILSGKKVLPSLPAHTVHKRIGAGNYKRRFDTKQITKEVRVLKIIRDMKNLSQEEAGRLCGLHRKSIGHIENGRVNMTEERINMLLKAYTFSKTEFIEMVEADTLRDEVINECTEILKTIEKDKLNAVRALLTNFK